MACGRDCIKFKELGSYHNSLICELCRSVKNIEVDHFEPQFIELKTAFLNNWNGTLPIYFKQNKCHSKIFINDDISFEKEKLSSAKIAYSMTQSEMDEMIDVVETMSLDDADVEELERNARQMLENR